MGKIKVCEDKTVTRCHLVFAVSFQLLKKGLLRSAGDVLPLCRAAKAEYSAVVQYYDDATACTHGYAPSYRLGRQGLLPQCVSRRCLRNQTPAIPSFAHEEIRVCCNHDWIRPLQLQVLSGSPCPAEHRTARDRVEGLTNRFYMTFDSFTIFVLRC